MLSLFLVVYLFAARSHSSIRDKLNLPIIIFIWDNVLIEETYFDKRIYHCKNRFQLYKNPRTYRTCQTSLFIPKIVKSLYLKERFCSEYIDANQKHGQHRKPIIVTVLIVSCSGIYFFWLLFNIFGKLFCSVELPICSSNKSHTLIWLVEYFKIVLFYYNLAHIGKICTNKM